MSSTRTLAAAIGVLAVAAGLTGASADPEQVTWSSTGCEPDGDLELGAGGVDGGALFTVSLQVRRPIEPNPLGIDPPPDAVDGDLDVTLLPLPAHRDREPWTRYEGLGFAMPAMEGDPEPFRASADVSVRRSTDPGDDGGGPSLVYHPAPAETDVEEFDPPYGAYAVLDAEFAINNDDGEAWCVVEATGSAEHPVAEFEIHPPQEDVDAEVSAMEQAEEEQRREEMAARMLWAGAALAVVVGLAGAARLLTRWRRRRAAADPPDSGGG